MQNNTSEIRKMRLGELYLASDPELVAMRSRARKLTRLYNQTTEEETIQRTQILTELFGKSGPKMTIEPPFHCDYGVNIFAEDDLYMNVGCVVLDCAEVYIGQNVLCGPYVQIYTASHPLDARVRASGPELAKAIRIGNRVWIGGGSILCPGISIGDNSTIGAGSVVVKDIPANVLAGGNPCRIIRNLSPV